MGISLHVCMLISNNTDFYYVILVISGYMQRIHKPEHYAIRGISRYMQHIDKPEQYVILVISGYMQHIHKP